MNDGNKIGRMTRTLVRGALDALFPRTCRVCGRSLVEGETLLCVGCMAALPRTRFHLDGFNSLHRRLGGHHPVEVAAAWFHYMPDSPYAGLIRRAKYDDRPLYARQMGAMYARELLADGVGAGFDVLLPVAMHPLKRFVRGYNQADEIARGMAGIFGCDVGDNLRAMRRHTTQTRRGAYERYSNIAGSFAVVSPHELDGLNVVIVDDVITTGSTIADCIRAVGESSAPASINVLSLGATLLKA